MDLVIASTGAVTPCEVAVHELESLAQLHLAIARLTCLPVAQLVLFLDDGRELGDEVFGELWEAGGEREGGGAREGASHRASLDGRDAAGTHINTDTASHPYSRTRIIVFDRTAFTADPTTYASEPGIAEPLVLAPPLAARPPPHRAGTGDLLTPLRANHARAHDAGDRVANQVEALSVAGANLVEHLGGLEGGAGGAGGEDGDEPPGCCRRRRRRRSTRSKDGGPRDQGSAAEVSSGSASDSSSGSSSAPSLSRTTPDAPGQASWKALIELELARERRLLGLPPAPSPGPGTVGPTPPGAADAGPSANAAGGRGYQRDLNIIDQVPVFGCFPRKDKRARGKSREASGAVRGAEPQTQTEATRDASASPGLRNWNGEMLGVHVRADAMRVVHESCRRIYDDHTARYDGLLGALDALRTDTAHVGDAIAQLVGEVQDELGALLEMTDRDFAEAERLSHEELDVHWDSLVSLDANIREQLQAIVDLKNEFTLQLHMLLHDISVQQSTIASLPPMLTALEETLIATRTNSKTGFPHLDRLHNMLHAYGSACIEVLWRKSTHMLLLANSGQFAENMADLLQRDRTRRERFENRELELLPWKTEITIFKADRPDLQMTTHGGAEGLNEWQLTEDDVADLLSLIERLATERPDSAGAPDLELLRIKRRLDKRLHSMQSSLKRLGRVMTSPGRDAVSISRRRELNGSPSNRSAGADENESLGVLRTEHASAIAALQAKLASAQSEVPDWRQKVAQAEIDSNHKADELAAQQLLLEDAKADGAALIARVSEATQKSADLAIELEESRRRLGELETARTEDLAQIQMLQGERSQLLSGLGDARTSEDQLAAQLTGVQAELAATLVALEEAQADRDQALRDQSATAERLIRDHLTEADGDRAVLEHQNVGLSKEIADLRARMAAEVTTTRNQSIREIDGLKAELGMAKAQVREAQRTKIKMQDEVIQGKDALSFASQETKRQMEIGRDAIRAASSFHECVARLHSAIKSSATISGSSVLEVGPDKEAAAKLAEATKALGPLSSSPEADESEVALLHELAALKTYDLAEFDKDVMRTMSLVKKWQKNCKQYRDKARDKLAFANFAKGDLALFLPTRNSTVRPWAAFNISSPHNFLRPTPAMENQIKVRDWIVARIVKVEEDVVDSKRPGSNPYELAEGIRFFILHVEPYTPSPPTRARRSSSGNTLDHASSAPMPSVSSTVGETPKTLERNQGDYFAAPTVPEPMPVGRVTIGPETLSPVPVAAEKSGLTLASAVSPRFAGADPSLPPFAAARRPSSGAYPDTPMLGTARRPPSVASSNGSFRQGIQYAASTKAAPTSGVTRPTAEARSPAAGRAVLVDENPFGPDARALSTSPAGPGIGGNMPGSFRPRLGSNTSQAQSGFAGLVRRETGGGGGGGGGGSAVPGRAGTGTSGTTARKGSIGLGQGALDILKRLEGGKGKGKE